jgi:hypothetical protein
VKRYEEKKGAVLKLKLKFKFKLIYKRTSVGQSVGLPSEVHDQIFVFSLKIEGFLI